MTLSESDTETESEDELLLSNNRNASHSKHIVNNSSSSNSSNNNIRYSIESKSTIPNKNDHQDNNGVKKAKNDESFMGNQEHRHQIGGKADDEVAGTKTLDSAVRPGSVSLNSKHIHRNENENQNAAAAAAANQNGKNIENTRNSANASNSMIDANPVNSVNALNDGNVADALDAVIDANVANAENDKKEDSNASNPRPQPVLAAVDRTAEEHRREEHRLDYKQQLANKHLVEQKVKDSKLAHEHDDERLFASGLEGINFTDTCTTQKMASNSGKSTLPIELYRLLRLSTLRPDLGLDQAISWTDDGNGFKILDETRFVETVLAQTFKNRKFVFFRNWLGQFHFVCIHRGKNRHGGSYRVYRHRSIAAAEGAKNPSLRKFYRGVPMETIRSIRCRRHERQSENEKEDVSSGSRSNPSERDDAKSKPDVTPMTVAAENTRNHEVDQEKSGSEKQHKPSKSIEHDNHKNDTSRDPIHTTNIIARKQDPKANKKRKRGENVMDRSKERKRGESVMDRSKERRLRRTSDGCLLPKGGSEHLLLPDGTFNIPTGARPVGLVWDSIRGLWVPPHMISSTKSRSPRKKRRKHSESHSEDRNRQDPRTTATMATISHQTQNPLAMTNTNSYGENSGKPTEERRTSDGCLLPKRKPFRNEDGTYNKPNGHVPSQMKWDEFKGIWIPKNRKKGTEVTIRRTTSASSFSASSLTNSSVTPGEENGTIIRASKAKLFHHSSSLWRTSYQFQKHHHRQRRQRRQSRRNHHSAPQKRLQARTKSNPSGITAHKINKSNWGKIERLMQLARRQRSATAAETAKTTTESLPPAHRFTEDGEVQLV